MARNRSTLGRRSAMRKALMALGISAAEVPNQPGHQRSEIGFGGEDGCLQIMIGPVRHLARSSTAAAGWVLHSHDQPECVSDSPDVR